MRTNRDGRDRPRQLTRSHDGGDVQMQNEAAINNPTLPFRPAATMVAYGDKEAPDITWANERMLDLGVKTMTQPVKPYWNTTMVTAWVAVIMCILGLGAAIAGLWVYTKNNYLELGDRQGYQRRQREETDEKLRQQADEINTLKKAAGLLPADEEKKK